MDEYSFQTNFENGKTADPWMVFPNARKGDKYLNLNEELKLQGLSCISLQMGIKIFASVFVMDLLF